ncbi:MAG: hypothetical protein ABSF92_00235 [Candidatus Acidiferrales bacterium]
MKRTTNALLKMGTPRSFSYYKALKAARAEIDARVAAVVLNDDRHRGFREWARRFGVSAGTLCGILRRVRRAQRTRQPKIYPVHGRIWT